MSITLNGYKVVPTIFPDGTSQVWKLPEEIISPIEHRIVWEFENEAELFHLMQLGWLLDYGRDVSKFLHMPYMPYGRQDKEISNETCFAQDPFMWILNSIGFEEVTTIDAHSCTHGVRSIYPGDAIRKAIEGTEATHVCFPDAGASRRYEIGLRCIVLDKERKPSTGEIKGLKLVESISKPADWKRLLIVDDICDGGRTFVESAKLLHGLAPNAVINLYVSHGIFSKGTKVLRDAGIKQIFTKNGEVLI